MSHKADAPDGQKVAGVLGSDFTLVDLARFLSELTISDSGEAFVTDRTGQILASSFSTTVADEAGQPVEVVTRESQLAQSTRDYLTEYFGSLENITAAQSFEYHGDGEHFSFQVRPYADEFGLDWLIIVIVPEADFTGTIHRETRNSLLLSLGIVAGTVLLALAISKWISQAMLKISQASQAIAKGNLTQQVPGSSIRELNVMSKGFNHMSQALLQSHTKLKNHAESLEVTVEKRTQDLAKSKQRYQSIFEDSPTALWEQDFSHVKAYLDSLKINTFVSNYTAYFNAHPEVVAVCISLVRVLAVNQAALDLFEASNKEDLRHRLSLKHSTRNFTGFHKELAALCQQQSVLEQEVVDYTLKGTPKNILFRALVAPGHESNWSRVLISTVDITLQKQAERKMQKRAQRDRLLSQVSRSLLEQDIDTAIIDVLKALCQFTNSDRSCVFQLSSQPSEQQQQLQLSHNWHRSDRAAFCNIRQHKSADAFPWLYQKLIGGHPFQIESVEQLPTEAAAEQAEFQQQSIKSFANAPMVYSDTVVGLVGLYSICHPVRNGTKRVTNAIELRALSKLRIHNGMAASAKNHPKTRSLKKTTPTPQRANPINRRRNSP